MQQTNRRGSEPKEEKGENGDGKLELSVANLNVVSPKATMTATATFKTTTTSAAAASSGVGAIPGPPLASSSSSTSVPPLSSSSSASSQQQQQPPPPQQQQQSGGGSERWLDFIGTSRVVKNLFSLPYSNDQPLCVAVHNLDGTLLMDTAMDTTEEDVHADDLFFKDHTMKEQQEQQHQHPQRLADPAGSSSSTITTLFSTALSLAVPPPPSPVSLDKNSSGTVADDGGGDEHTASNSGSRQSASSNSEALSLLSRVIQQERDKQQLIDYSSCATTATSTTSSASSSVSSSCSQSLPPNPPREYLEWKFQDMNLLVGSDALVVRSHDPTMSSSPPTPTTSTSTALAIRVEDATNLKQLLQHHVEMVERGHFIPDHQLDKMTQRGKPSYAQALIQQQPQQLLEESQHGDGLIKEEQDEKDEAKHQVVVGSFAAPNLDQVRLQTCIVPSSGPLGGLLADGPSTCSSTNGLFSSSSDPTANNSPPPTTTTTPSSPVSIVLDAYLDNVIANVPQLALCLREKGFIQSIKLLETDDIPSMFLRESTLDTSLPFQHVIQDHHLHHRHSTGSSSHIPSQPSAATPRDEEIFSPEIMEMNASTLLRFLQTNCSRDNSTYLLRREAGQANIQLYDISSISTQRQRKWSWWLATMSYRFALRLRHLERDLLTQQQQQRQQQENNGGLDNNKNTATSIDLSLQRRRFRHRQRSLYQTTLHLLEDLADMDGRVQESLVASVNEHMADTFLGPPDNSTNEESMDIDETDPNRAATSPPPPSASSSSPITQQQQQPYGNIPVDGLSKAQDHLLNGIKTLWPVLKKNLQEAQQRQEERHRRRRRRPRQSHQQQQRVTTAQDGTASSSSGSEEDQYPSTSKEHQKGNPPDVSTFLPSEALIMQLFGLHCKMINVSLRLAEHHLRNYFSSSAMQALRTAARRMADSGSLLHLLHHVTNNNNNNSSSRRGPKQPDLPSSKRHKELLQGLQLQYIWLFEHCGHFARSFASDELWRERGHACGDDVISVLRDVEAAFAEREVLWNDTLNDKDDDDGTTTEAFAWYNFSNAADPLAEKTRGLVNLYSLSAIVDPQIVDTTKITSHLQNSASIFVSAASAVLDKQGQLKRDKRQVLVASCVSYSRAIRAFEAMLLLHHHDATGDPPVAVNVDPPILHLLRQRLGDSYNETGKVLLAALRTLLSSPPPKTDGDQDDLKRVPLAAEAFLSSAQFWFLEGLEAFEGCKDLRNLALLRCNLCQCFKLRANSSFATQKDAPDGTSHAEICLQEAANHLQAAHEALGEREVDPMTWDMVSDELAATFLVLSVRRRQSLLGGGNTPVILPSLRLQPGKERSIIYPMERALKIYEQSGNAHQAAAVHYQLALTNSKIWTCQRDETKTREKLASAFLHYNMAFAYFRTSLRGNEPTYVLLCLDLASLYAAVSGEECLTKALSRCLDTLEAFSRAAIDTALSSNNNNVYVKEWFEKMTTLASSVEDRVFKLLRSLVKLDNSTSRFKELYRVGLTAKMAQKAADEEMGDYNTKARELLALHDVLLAIQEKSHA